MIDHYGNHFNAIIEFHHGSNFATQNVKIFLSSQYGTPDEKNDAKEVFF